MYCMLQEPVNSPESILVCTGMLPVLLDFMLGSTSPTRLSVCFLLGVGGWANDCFPLASVKLTSDLDKAGLVFSLRVNAGCHPCQ